MNRVSQEITRRLARVGEMLFPRLAHIDKHAVMFLSNPPDAF